MTQKGPLNVRVLIADDDVVTRELLARTLGGWNLDVRTVGDGQAAWAELQSAATPVLAILDWMMPMVEGPELCRRVRSERPDANVHLILLTARNSPDDLATGLDAGADDYLTKPFNYKELRARVEVGLRMLALQDRLNERVENLQQALMRIETSERQYRALFEESRDAICVTNVEGSLIDVNPAAVAMFGYAKPELLGTNVRGLMPTPGDADAMYAVVPPGTDVLQHDVRFRRKDGEVRDCTISPSVRHDDAGRLIGFQGIIRDVTEARRLEGQLRQSHKMEAVGRLAGGIAHDFNNLLTGISGYTELILDALSPGDPLRESAEEVARAAQSAARLTQQLLAFSRRQVLKPEVVDLNRVISGLTGILQRTLGENIAIDFRLAPETTAVKADACQLQQVILNLAINARDAMPDGGRLTIETSRLSVVAHSIMPAGEYASLVVSDTGVGIPPEVQAHIFEPFFTTKGKTGTGLGLSTVYGIVKQSGGFIWLESQAGCGTSFRVELPLCEDALTSSPAARIEAGVASAAATILLVEDEAIVRELVSKQIRRAGYTLLSAAHPAEALAMAAEYGGRIDLLLTDVVMPKMSGPALATELRRTRPGTRVLLMSGYPGTAGLSDYPLLPKPFSQRDLLAKVQQILSDGDSPHRGGPAERRGNLLS